MKKKISYLLFVAILFFSQYSISQVNSNGTTTPNITAQNAFLDASTNFDSSVDPSSNGKGLIFPRTDLTTWTFNTELLDGITFPTAFDGMIVYNIGTGSTIPGQGQTTNVSPGYYYFFNPGATTDISSGVWKVFGSSGSGAVQNDCNAPGNGFNGIFRSGLALNGTTFKVTITNNTFSQAQITPNVSDLLLSGVTGVSVSSVSPNTLTIINSGESLDVIYTLSGTLNTIGTLVGNWQKLNLSCSKSIEITNGAAIISNYSCSTASNGNLFINENVSGVTQTITANVITDGYYSISTTANGITFSGTGVLTATGDQDIVLTATGLPVNIESTTFSLGTTPDCSFNRDVLINPSSNGTASVSSYSCNTASANVLYANQLPTGVSHTVTANVLHIGSYAISAIANGITFSASGSFTDTGNQDIVLTASGMSSVIGTSNFTLNTTPNCNFDRYIDFNPTSGGSAVIASIDCSNPISGNLIVSNSTIGVSKVIVVDVTTIGTYSISTSANGVTFSATGSFSTTGSQNITLNASGIPTNISTNTFYLSTAPSCSFDATTLINPSSNGTAAITSFISETSGGTLIVNQTVSGVFHNLTVNVATLGTYSISTTANGITLAASGTFTTLGSQTITLTATGIPSEIQNTSFTTNTTPSVTFTLITNGDPTSGGTAIVQAYTCNTASSGTLNLDAPAYLVTQTITANVTTAGTYSISAVSNGVTFAGTGTFSATGNQDLVLTASGSPTVQGTNTYNLSTTPNCSFTRNVNFDSSGGSAVVSSYTVGTATGYLIRSLTPSSVTQTLTANVTTVGSYNIYAISNGVTYSASGTFSSTGNQNIVLTASGTATNFGNTNFVLNTSVPGTFTKKILVSDRNYADANHKFVYDTYTSATGRVWLNNNLGADYNNVNYSGYNPYQMAQNLGVGSSNIVLDQHAAGSLFEWGRYSDGHELFLLTRGLNSGVFVNVQTSTVSNTDTPVDSKFIYNIQTVAPNNTNDWRVPSNPNLWQGVDGINNPCPIGFRVPTKTEIETELTQYSITAPPLAYSSIHKFVATGFRSNSSGSIFNSITSNIYIWTSTFDNGNPGLNSNTAMLNIGGTVAAINSSTRATGRAVRCIKD